MEHLDKLLEAALTAVGESCHVARRAQSQLQPLPQLLKKDRSPVTVADFAVQSIVCHRLASMVGEIRLVGEETSEALRLSEQSALCAAVVRAAQEIWPHARSEDVLAAIDLGAHDATARAYWTLDPIDGTKGFLRGGQYAIALAYIDRGEVLLGVMGCPNLSTDFERSFNDPDPRGLIYFATKGRGAWVSPTDSPHGQRSPVKSDGPGQAASLRVCESLESSHSNQDGAARLSQELGGQAAPLRLDSQAKYAVVARGQADAYLRLPIGGHCHESIWDHAAGMLIATEAGAVVTDITGLRLDFSCGARLARNRGIVCASPRFHQKIIDTIDRLGLGSAPSAPGLAPSVTQKNPDTPSRRCQGHLDEMHPAALSSTGVYGRLNTLRTPPNLV